MSFAQDNGYTPTTFSDLMNAVREAINTQFGTDYSEGTFIGTNWYKYFYVLIQKVLENETKTSEVFLKLQEYILTTNLKIQRPSVSLPGLVESFASQGFIASVKPNDSEDAGTVSVAIDIDDGIEDYAEKRLQLCNLLKEYVAAGMVFTGTDEESIVLDNGQSFDFSYHLPDETPILLKLTITSSENLDAVIPNDEEIRQVLFDNINERYRIGYNFEPQRYFTQVDAPYAATILLEYSVDDGENWTDDVFVAEFDDKFTFDEGDIAVLVDPE